MPIAEAARQIALGPFGQAFIAAIAAVGTAILVALFARVAPVVGLVDRPGGRKHHDSSVPLVGGIALAHMLLCSDAALGTMLVPPCFLAAAVILVAVSVWDDWKDLHHLPRFAGQIVAVLVMIHGGDVALHSLGDLLGWRPIGLAAFSTPVTLIAVVGVINAINMIDGMDGLAGSLSFVAFAWYGVAASLSGLAELAALAWLLCGGLAGFLLFNMRLPWQPRARVFLGDAGSTLLGFSLAWFAIDLTQHEGRTMPPIAAVWVVLLPLMDTLSLMARRLARGRSPFHPDREHIHHFVQALGFPVGEALLLLVGVSAIFGAVGVVGWRMGVPEAVLFWTSIALFLSYHFAMQNAWNRMRTGTGGVYAEPSRVRVPILDK